MPPKYTRPKSKKRKPKAKAKNARARKAKFRPRNTIRTAPSAAPNVYNFKRTYDHPLYVYCVCDSLTAALGPWGLQILTTMYL